MGGTGHDKGYDAIVVGLGGMGSAAAYHLAGRGMRVLGLERYAPAHDKGSSHGQSRIVRQAYFEGPDYVPLLLRAYELWERLEGETGEDLLTLTGGLMIGAPDSRTVAGSVESANAHDLPYEMLDAEDLARRFPVFTPPPGTVALFEKNAGFVRPEMSVRAHLRRAEATGAALRFGEQTLSWEPTPSGVRVETENADGERSVFEAERLVVTAGAWAPGLLSDLGLPLEVTRQVLFWFDPKGGVGPFLPENFPVFIWDPEDGNQFYAIPAHDGDAGGVKAAFFRGGVSTDPETIDRTVREEEADPLRGYLAGRVPALDGGLVRAVACMYTNTPDEHFVISTHPEHPQVAVAAGFSGHGYKFCGVVGEILADLATEGSTPHPIGMFSPERLTGPAGPRTNA